MRVDRERLKKRCRVSVTIEPEDLDWRKEFDDATARAWIKAQLFAGNQWAWCTVAVTASWLTWTETDYLGACSYENEAAFRAEGGYFDQMVDDCVNAIARQIEDALGTHDLWEHDRPTCLECIANDAA